MQFLLVSVVLVVPTTCMGATLPILSKWAVQQEITLGVTIGRLYALNTFGAVLGTALERVFPASQFGGPDHPLDCRIRKYSGGPEHPVTDPPGPAIRPGPG